MSKANKANFVAKYMNEVNRSAVMQDQKKADKRGYSKHKGRRYQQDW